MNGIRLVGILLIAAGILALVYGSFTYTSKTHSTEIGPLEIAIDEKNTVNIPIWAGIAGIVVGGGMIVAKRRR